MQHTHSKLKSRNPADRLSGIRDLGRATPEASNLKSLGDALADAEQNCRVEAVKSLGRLGREAVPLLLQALEHADAYVRREATASLGKLGQAAADAVPALSGALRDPDTKVRMGAATALGQVGPAAQQAIPQMIQILRDPNLILCRLASQSLSMLGGAAVGPLTEALRNCDSGVRREAAWALGQIGPEASAAIPALMEILAGRDGAPPLPQSSDSPRPSAENVATAIMNIAPLRNSDTQVVAGLAVTAGAPESDLKVRQAVTQALERIQGKK